MTPRAPAMAPDDRRRAIVDVVVPLLLDHGHEVTTRQIAEAAGIAEGTIFRVFPDKDALWLAVAEHALDPEVERAELAAALDGTTDLREQIERIADHLLSRSQRVMAVMWMLRTRWIKRGEPGQGGPPPFMVEANHALMAALGEVFAAHEDELSVTPQVAARALRSLVLGQRHPGAHADHLLGPTEVADLMLSGILRREDA